MEKKSIDQSELDHREGRQREFSQKVETYKREKENAIIEEESFNFIETNSV